MRLRARPAWRSWFGRSARGPAGVGAFALALFLWVALTGVLAKLWRAYQLWDDAGAVDGFVWLPVGLAAELLMGALAALVVVVSARVLPRALAIVVGLAAALTNLWWVAINMVSFTITQAPITFTRLRGDEGVRMHDAHLIRWNDALPAATLALLLVLGFAPLLWATARLRRRFPHLGARQLAPLCVAALVLYAADACWWRAANFGVADAPALILARSIIEVKLSEARAPTLVDGARPDLRALALSKTPSEVAPPPPLQKAGVKNVIVFFSEGVARKHTSLGGEHDSTPNVARRARADGLELTRYYSPYHKSIAAIFAMACSAWPPSTGINITELNPRIDCGELSEVLRGHGIHAGLFHGGDFGFYDKLMLLGMRGYEIQEDARIMSDYARWEENEWGVDDRATVDHTLAWIDSLPPGERFTALMIPITAHWPYWIPSDVEPRFPGLGSRERYLSAVAFLDDAFERLLVGLEQRGLDQDTAVIFLADHGETIGERPRASAGARLAYEPSLNTPFVILNPGMWPAGSQSDRIGSHVDLAPTVLDLLGLPPDARHHGVSLLAPDREPRRVFLGANNGQVWVGLLDGMEKYTLNTRTGAQELYDLRLDPDERHNLAVSAPPEQLAALEADTLSFSQGVMDFIADAPAVGTDLDVQGALVAHAEVRVRRPARGAAGEQEAETVLCVVDPNDPTGARLCPGEERSPFLGRQKRKAGGRVRDCVVVNAPDRGGVLEIEVGEAPFLPFLTRLRTAFINEPARDDAPHQLVLEVDVDGEPAVRSEVVIDKRARVPFASPRGRFLLRVSGEAPAARDLCVTFTEKDWGNRWPTPLGWPAGGAPLKG
ncbi:MAG: sulfatase-like hydrolase/transferase [Deltaproteobacteria bacterium]|nr:sulfatase-like hydrolase/transferase [Deltaproteobacteria bacterium]